MCDWTDCPGREASVTDANMTTPNQLIKLPHPQSHNHASTSGGARTNCERFSTFVDDDELAALSKGVVPANTDKCTRWALSNFAAWKKARNEKHPEDPVPEDIFACNDASTSGGARTNCERFSTFVDDDELAALSKGVVPANTDKCTRWALSNFAAWKKARNEKHPEDPVPEDIFACNDPATLNTHLSRFVLETRKSNGDFYPPKTLHQLLCGLLRHMRDVNPGCLNFLDKKDSRFKPLHGTMDPTFTICTRLELAERQSMQEC